MAEYFWKVYHLFINPMWTEEQVYEHYLKRNWLDLMSLVRPMTIKEYERYAYPAIPDIESSVHEEAASNDPELSPVVQKQFKFIEWIYRTHKYLPSLVVSWNISSFIGCYLEKMPYKYSYLTLLRPVVLGMAALGYFPCYFTVGKLVENYCQSIDFGTCLAADLNDPRLSKYRLRLYNEFPEVFTPKYLRDTALRERDGTLPVEVPDEERHIEESLKLKED
jgi:hypothetical protein